MPDPTDDNDGTQPLREDASSRGVRFSFAAVPSRMSVWRRTELHSSYPEVIHTRLAVIDDNEVPTPQLRRSADAPQPLQPEIPSNPATFNHSSGAARQQDNMSVQSGSTAAAASSSTADRSSYTIVIPEIEIEAHQCTSNTVGSSSMQASGSGVHSHVPQRRDVASGSGSSGTSAPAQRMAEARQHLLSSSSANESLGESSNSSKIPRVASGGSAACTGSSGGAPGVCLICLDTLTPADFESGEAMSVECKCKGDVALRHRSCAIKWSQVKGSTICEVCKAPIANLPPVEVPGDNPDAPGDDSAQAGRSNEPPDTADYVFDCIRITWITMIGCILFFEFTMTRSFLTGILVGIVYTAMRRAVHNAQRQRALAQENANNEAGLNTVLV